MSRDGVDDPSSSRAITVTYDPWTCLTH